MAATHFDYRVGNPPPSDLQVLTLISAASHWNEKPLSECRRSLLHESSGTSSSAKSKESILNWPNWKPSGPWLSSEILSIKVMNRIEGKEQPWASPPERRALTFVVKAPCFEWHLPYSTVGFDQSYLNRPAVQPDVHVIDFSPYRVVITAENDIVAAPCVIYCLIWKCVHLCSSESLHFFFLF